MEADEYREWNAREYGEAKTVICDTAFADELEQINLAEEIQGAIDKTEDLILCMNLGGLRDWDNSIFSAEIDKRRRLALELEQIAGKIDTNYFPGAKSDYETFRQLNEELISHYQDEMELM